MPNPLDYPLLLFPLPLVTYWLAASLGAWFHHRTRKVKQEMKQDSHDDFVFVLGGTLTLLGMIIGFTFSMAVSRYEQRKNYEEQEANAIGTEYVRTDLLPPEGGAKLRSLLKRYLDQRILNYNSRGRQRLQQINAQTALLQDEMWSVVAKSGTAQPSIVTALAISGMNDVLNAQGYTQAAWWNRIPLAAWALLLLISIFCNLMIGYVAHGRSGFLFLVLPIALSISFFLVADIDSPRGGIIRVCPQNLQSLAESLRSH